MESRKKLVLILLFLICATYSYSQIEEKILISGNYIQQDVRDILADINSNYNISFFYLDKWIPVKAISIHLENSILSQALTSILKETELDFIIYGSAVIIAPGSLVENEYSTEYFQAKQKQNDLLNSTRWNTISDIIQVGDSTLNSVKKTISFEGIITDKLTAEPLPGVNLNFKTLNRNVTSDNFGHFRNSLPTGNNFLEVSHVGYDSRNILLQIFNQDSILIELSPVAYEMEELLIYGERGDDNINSVIVGITKLKPRQIKELPVFLGETDVIQSILTLPGVTSFGEGTTGFSVRGGSLDQNFIIQDEAIIYNSSHALGIFSVFNPDVLQSVTFYKSHIPAQYGSRISSVLEIELDGDNKDKLTGNGGIGFATGRFAIKGPIDFNKQKSPNSSKLTFLAGARATYSGWILNMINNPQIRNSSVSFNDLNFKLNYRYSDKGFISASYFQSYDYVKFSEEYGFSWKNQATSINWNHLPAPDLSSNFSISFSNNENNSFEPSGIDAFELKNGISNIRIREEFLFSGLESHNISAGIEFIDYFIKPDILTPYGADSGILSEKVNKDDGREFGIFLNDEYNINSRISLSTGLRFNTFQQVGPGDTYIYENNDLKQVEFIVDTIMHDSRTPVKSFHFLEPRISLKYSLNSTSSVKVVYNRINQFIHLMSNSTAAVPIDYWQVSGPYILPKSADSYSVGYFRNFRENVWETSLEVFYKDLKNVVDFKDFPDILLNDHIETEILTGKGRSYGGELLIKKSGRKFNGSFSYAYTRSFIKMDKNEGGETINNGEWYPSQLDRPHNINLNFNVYINKSNTFSVNFSYLSGRKITAPVSNYFQNIILIPHYGERNQYRIPDYHRLDISYTIKRNVIRKRKFKDSFTFSIFNLYGRKNAYSIFFRKFPGKPVSAYKLSILGTVFPSITYNFEF